MVSSLSFLFYKIQFVIFSFFIVFFFSFLFFFYFLQQTFIFHSSEGWKSKIRVPTRSGSGENSLLGLQTATSLLCLHMTDREIDLFFNILLFIYLAVLAAHRIFDLRFNMLDLFGCSMQVFSCSHVVFSCVIWDLQLQRANSQLWHANSQLWHVGSSSLTREKTQTPLH